MGNRVALTSAAALAIFGFTAVISAAEATTYKVTDVQNPSSPYFTQLLGINNAMTIGGANNEVSPAGFTLTLPSTFTVQNFPGSATSMVTGINNSGSTSGIYVDAGGTTHGYTDIGGTFATVDRPGTVFNQALGINDANVTVGYDSAIDPGGVVGQVAYEQSGGVFTAVPLPANSNSQAVGINNADDIVGFYMPTPTTSVGFLDIGGVISTIDPFGSVFTQALGINASGEIVEFYADAAGTPHGYIDNGGAFTSFDPTGSFSTTINGLNAQGDIVGFFSNAEGSVIGFVGTPVPEPSTWAMMLAGFSTLGFLGCRTSRRSARRQAAMEA